MFWFPSFDYLLSTTIAVHRYPFLEYQDRVLSQKGKTKMESHTISAENSFLITEETGKNIQCHSNIWGTKF